MNSSIHCISCFLRGNEPFFISPHRVGSPEKDPQNFSRHFILRWARTRSRTGRTNGATLAVTGELGRRQWRRRRAAVPPPTMSDRFVTSRPTSRVEDLEDAARLRGSLLSVCVCVCVWEREKKCRLSCCKRERGERTDRAQAASSPILQRRKKEEVAFKNRQRALIAPAM